MAGPEVIHSVGRARQGWSASAARSFGPLPPSRATSRRLVPIGALFPPPPTTPRPLPVAERRLAVTLNGEKTLQEAACPRMSHVTGMISISARSPNPMGLVERWLFADKFQNALLSTLFMEE
jgi:hypothetical protein